MIKMLPISTAYSDNYVEEQKEKGGSYKLFFNTLIPTL